MNRRICRQVLDCGDGVREVTAFALAALKIPKLAADTATPQSGDSADSVACLCVARRQAAVQDARAPTRAAFGYGPKANRLFANCIQSYRLGSKGHTKPTLGKQNKLRNL
jgi:hypothetical protein